MIMPIPGSIHIISTIYLLRYLDNIFFIWQHGLEEQQICWSPQLQNWLHDIHHEVSREEFSFLDIAIKFNTDLFCKPTHLLYSSVHPYHCKKSIPYSQFLRIWRICSNMSDFNWHNWLSPLSSTTVATKATLEKKHNLYQSQKRKQK